MHVVLWIIISTINISSSMSYLNNFHADYPDAHVILANCGDTISLSCPIESDNDLVRSTSMVRILVFFSLQNVFL